MSKEIVPREIERRAELLFIALELLYDEPERQMLHKEFIGLLKTAPNSVPICASLVKHDIITVNLNGRQPAIVKYIGIAPNHLVCKKVVEQAVKDLRQFNIKHRAKKVNNKVSTVAELSAVQVKPAPLHYDAFLREIKILKERYKLTVPNAEIEVSVKVSSLANV